MSQVEELESRITAALDRIARGVDTLSAPAEAPAADPEELDRVKAELADEKLVTGQLEERIKALHEKQDSKLAEAEAKATEAEAQTARQAEALAQLDAELQRLRKANDQLRASNAALREANEKGVGEPHLINKAMLTELEGLRAARAADSVEVQVVLQSLEKLLETGEGA